MKTAIVLGLSILVLGALAWLTVSHERTRTRAADANEAAHREEMQRLDRTAERVSLTGRVAVLELSSTTRPLTRAEQREMADARARLDQPEMKN